MEKNYKIKEHFNNKAEYCIWTFYYRFQEFPASQKILLRHLFHKVGNRIRLIWAQRAPMILWLIIGRSGISRELDGGGRNKRWWGRKEGGN